MRAMRRVDAGKRVPRLLLEGLVAGRTEATPRSFSCSSHLDVTGASNDATITSRKSMHDGLFPATAALVNDHNQEGNTIGHESVAQNATVNPTTTTTTSTRNEMCASRTHSSPAQALNSTISHSQRVANTAVESRIPLMSYEKAKELTKVMENPNFQKLGSFSKNTWRELIPLVQSWTQFYTAESVDCSVALLERLIREQELLHQNVISAPVFQCDQERAELQKLSRELLSTTLLNQVINAWRLSWKLGHTKLSPLMAMSQLLEYLDRSPSLHPDTKTYNMVLDAATNRFGHEAAQELGEDILQRMTNTSRDEQPMIRKKQVSSFQPEKLSSIPRLNGKLRCINDISPDAVTYNTIMNLYARAGKGAQAADILNRMNKDFLAGKSTVQPNTEMFTTCISAWARSKQPNAPEKAEEIVKLMETLAKEKSLRTLKPNVKTFNALIDCWAKSRRTDQGEQAERVLRFLEMSTGIRPDFVSYNTVILAWSHGPNCNIDRARSVLDRMFGSFMRGNDTARPNEASYNFLLDVFFRYSDQDPALARLAELYLGRMKKLNIQPSIRTYNLVLGCLAKSRPNRPHRLKRLGARADRILREMRDPLSAERGVYPTTVSYQYVINALAAGGQAMQAEVLFKSMYAEYSRGNKNVKPNVFTFNSVLSAWKNTDAVSEVQRVAAIVRLLHEIPKSGEVVIKPDIVSLNTLLKCLSYVDSKSSRNHAETMLMEMEREWKATGNKMVRPDKMSYTSLMRCYANIGDVSKTTEMLNHMLEEYEAGNEFAKPDIISFNNILIAIARGAKGRNVDAGDQAEAVFKGLYDYHSSGVLDCLPNKYSYDLKISCWANSGNPQAAEQAELILEEMSQRGMEPDAATYTAVINAHARLGDYDRAEAFLRKMLEEYSKGNHKMEPTIITINTVLSAFARSSEPRAAEKAEVYLREMLTRHEWSLFDLRPDAVTFSTIITTWANSGDPRAAEKAKSLFREVEILSKKVGFEFTLDAGFFKSVLRACASSGGAAIAEALLKEIGEGTDFPHITPDRYMYQAVLQAYAVAGTVDAPEKAEALLRQMKFLAFSTKALKPDAACYHYVLECWAASSDLKLAAARADELLLDMEEQAKNGDASLKPTPATYSG